MQTGVPLQIAVVGERPTVARTQQIVVLGLLVTVGWAGASAVSTGAAKFALDLLACVCESKRKRLGSLETIGE